MADESQEKAGNGGSVHEATQDPAPVMVHPNLAELYRRRVAELEQLLLDPEWHRYSLMTPSPSPPVNYRSAPERDKRAEGYLRLA
jgi:hypothetical protein